MKENTVVKSPWTWQPPGRNQELLHRGHDFKPAPGKASKRLNEGQQDDIGSFKDYCSTSTFHSQKESLLWRFLFATHWPGQRGHQNPNHIVQKRDSSQIYIIPRASKRLNPYPSTRGIYLGDMDWGCTMDNKSPGAKTILKSWEMADLNMTSSCPLRDYLNSWSNDWPIGHSPSLGLQKKTDDTMLQWIQQDTGRDEMLRRPDVLLVADMKLDRRLT